MPRNTAPVAVLELVEVTADGSRTPLRIELGQPRLHGRGAWACLVSVDGYDRPAKDIYGEDSLQSLCLGLRMVRLHLECALARGSRLVDPDEGTDFPMDAYFEELSDVRWTDKTAGLTAVRFRFDRFGCDCVRPLDALGAFDAQNDKRFQRL